MDLKKEIIKKLHTLPVNLIHTKKNITQKLCTFLNGLHRKGLNLHGQCLNEKK